MFLRPGFGEREPARVRRAVSWSAGRGAAAVVERLPAGPTSRDVGRHERHARRQAGRQPESPVTDAGSAATTAGVSRSVESVASRAARRRERLEPTSVRWSWPLTCRAKPPRRSTSAASRRHSSNVRQTRLRQSCLLARRLVENGVRFVQVYYVTKNEKQPWDTHSDNNNSTVACARTAIEPPPLC